MTGAINRGPRTIPLLEHAAEEARAVDENGGRREEV